MMMMLVYVVVAMVLVLVRWCWISLEFCRVITLYFMHFIKPRRQKKMKRKPFPPCIHYTEINAFYVPIQNI